VKRVLLLPSLLGEASPAWSLPVSWRCAAGGDSFRVLQALGGKAGSDIKHGRLVEHGYHVFPQWYPNVRAIVDRIGVRLIDFDRYHYLVAVARVIAWLEEKLSPHQPDASGVRRRATPKLQMDARPPRKP
jgi:hypothetical protein